MSDKRITCTHCGSSFGKEDLTRSCANCFACTGCEIYICPSCRNEIVVKPMEKNRKGPKPGGSSVS